MKPPPGLALLHYLDAFDLDMAYSLRERYPTFLIEEDHFSKYSLIPSDQQFVFASEDLWDVQIEEYQRGY